MAAMVKSSLAARRRGCLALPCLLQRERHSHTQPLWEHILGRKIESATAKALEEAYVEMKVSKSVPSWLPFSRNSSFWIPSSEETIKKLEHLAERIQKGRPSPKSRVSTFEVDPDISDNGISSATALSTFQVADQLLDRLNDGLLENGTSLLFVSKNEVEDDSYEELAESDEDEAADKKEKGT